MKSMWEPGEDYADYLTYFKVLTLGTVLTSMPCGIAAARQG